MIVKLINADYFNQSCLFCSKKCIVEKIEYVNLTYLIDLYCSSCEERIYLNQDCADNNISYFSFTCTDSNNIVSDIVFYEGYYVIYYDGVKIFNIKNIEKYLYRSKKILLKKIKNMVIFK